MRQLIENQSATLELYPSKRASSATVQVVEPGGDDLVSAGTAASVDAVSTTVATVASNQAFTLASASSVVVGRKYEITSATQGSCVVEVSSISGTSIELTEPAAVDIAVSDEFRGLRITYALSSSLTGDRGQHYRADWTVTPADGGDVQAYREIFSIGRMALRPACSKEAVIRLLSFQYPSSVSRYSSQELENIAERASAIVQRLIEKTGRATELIGDASAFRDSGIHALKLCLSDDGLTPGNAMDLVSFQESTRDQLLSSVHDALNALQWYDKDDDGVVTRDREIGPFSIRVVL